MVLEVIGVVVVVAVGAVALVAFADGDCCEDDDRKAKRRVPRPPPSQARLQEPQDHPCFDEQEIQKAVQLSLLEAEDDDFARALALSRGGAPSHQALRRGDREEDAELQAALRASAAEQEEDGPSPWAGGGSSSSWAPAGSAGASASDPHGGFRIGGGAGATVAGSSGDLPRDPYGGFRIGGGGGGEAT